MKITTGKQPKPRRTMLYGVHGIGKSTWAAQAPQCLFLNLEDGLSDIECSRSEVIISFDQLLDCLRWLNEEKHDFLNIAVDTADWLERLIHKTVAHAASKDSIADIGYGAGYKQALAYWDKVLFALDWLRAERGIGIILLAHCDVKRFEPPEQDGYDRYQPALHSLASAKIQEWCDEVLFVNYEVRVSKEDKGFNQTRTKATRVEGAARQIQTQETAGVVAKNRLSLPLHIEFSWASYAQYFSSTPAGNIEGVVVDGSSKVRQ